MKCCCCLGFCNSISTMMLQSISNIGSKWINKMEKKTTNLAMELQYKSGLFYPLEDIKK